VKKHEQTRPRREPAKKPGEAKVQRARHLARARTDDALKRLEMGEAVEMRAFEPWGGGWLWVKVAPLSSPERGKALAIVARIPQVVDIYYKDGRIVHTMGASHYADDVSIRGVVVEVIGKATGKRDAAGGAP